MAQETPAPGKKKKNPDAAEEERKQSKLRG